MTLSTTEIIARLCVGSAIPQIEQSLMRQFGYTLEEARAIAQSKRRRAGKLRAARYARHAAPKGGALR